MPATKQGKTPFPALERHQGARSRVRGRPSAGGSRCTSRGVCGGGSGSRAVGHSAGAGGRCAVRNSSTCSVFQRSMAGSRASWGDGKAKSGVKSHQFSSPPPPGIKLSDGAIQKKAEKIWADVTIFHQSSSVLDKRRTFSGGKYAVHNKNPVQFWCLTAVEDSRFFVYDTQKNSLPPIMKPPARVLKSHPNIKLGRGFICSTSWGARGQLAQLRPSSKVQTGQLRNEPALLTIVNWRCRTGFAGEKKRHFLPHLLGENNRKPTPSLLHSSKLSYWNTEMSLGQKQQESERCTVLAVLTVERRSTESLSEGLPRGVGGQPLNHFT